MNVRRLGLIVCLLLSVVRIFPPAVARSQTSPIPLLAYYYIWYDTQTWDRAKIDYPLLGHYSSDDRSVMEEHVKMAKSAGIDGFIVSWKSTYKLDQRLKQLMDVAAEQNFSLWIIYQGLDFDRNPLPVDRIINDLQYFVDTYANHPAFGMYDLPVVILSGSWEFSAKDIGRIRDAFHGRLYLLGSERNVKDYLRIADKVDGNAYYWSSVDPTTFPGYEEKLSALGAAVHDHRGIWLAPAAPGFDARLIGGTRVVDRQGGQTLRTELTTAMHSNPDAIGIISWNEFSENTQIEPSEKYGSVALDMIANRQSSQAPLVANFDSSAPGNSDLNVPYQLLILFALLMLVVMSVGAIVSRQRAQKP
jgi:hypothetical protein